MDSIKLDTVPCKWCGRPTIMQETGMCERCWELDHRIRNDTDIAKDILRHYQYKKEKKMKCFKSYPEAMCCCNCKHQYPIYKHPGNSPEGDGHGMISDLMGYGCLHPELPDRIIFFDRRHGLCEGWEIKPDEPKIGEL